MQKDEFEIAPFPDLSAFRRKSDSARRLRVCIVTEEIFGPVRNGGISSTYMYLAKMLAKAGHDVSVLYLKGNRCEDHTIQYWIDWYARDNVKLVPLPLGDSSVLGGSWQTKHYAAYQWLKDQPDFDVVHTSEWRGGCYYALLAKRQGIAFQNTVFLVKTSSPHVWNRHYQMQFLGDAEAMKVLYPEQMCVENADIVIGGSAHLLRFMESVGYTLPEGRVFVQPNVIELAHLDVEDKRPPLEPGDSVQTDELAFFGRLETRKGLEVFCEALDYLVARGSAPKKVSFLGKPGALLSEPDMNSVEYIERRARHWPFEIEIHTGFNQLQVISYLTERPRIAVMPSLIENSTMAVYEALIYKIPFVASNSGGTPELVAPEHHEETLVAARPRDLANGLERALRDGARVGKCSFDNARNLEVWNEFHEFLADRFNSASAAQIIAEMDYGSGSGAPDDAPATLSACVVHRGETQNAQAVIDELTRDGASRPDQIVIAVHEHGTGDPVFDEIQSELKAPEGVDLTIVPANETSLGEAYNVARAQATGQILVFLRSDIHRPRVEAAGTFRTAFAGSGADVFTCFCDTAEGSDGETVRRIAIGADMAAGFHDRFDLGGRMIGVSAGAFDTLGGFTDIFGVDGVEHNLVFCALDRGMKVEIIPEALFVERMADSTLALNRTSAQYLVARDLIQSKSYPLRRLLLLAGSGLSYAKTGGASSPVMRLALASLPSRLREPKGLHEAVRGERRWTKVLRRKPLKFEEWLAVRRLNKLGRKSAACPGLREIILTALPKGIDSVETVEYLATDSPKWSVLWRRAPWRLAYGSAVRRLQRAYRRGAY